MANYILPELYVPSKKAKDQRPYVQFWIFSQPMGKLVRKRIFDLEGHNIKEKCRYAKQILMPYLAKELQQGLTISTQNDKKISELSGTKIYEALKSALNIKMITLGKRAKESYSYYFRTFDRFISDPAIELESCLLVNFGKDNAKAFQLWLKEKGFSNRTNRNHTDTMRVLFNVIIDGDNSPVSKNPFVKLDRLSVGMGKNHAYPKKYQKLILDLARERYPSMYLVINTMFYTLMRTNELAMLQRKHIDMFHEDKIYLPSEDNTKREIERHIVITRKLKQLFEEHGIYDAPDDYYIFSNTSCKPGPDKIPTARLGERYNNWVMQKIPELKGNKDYTLYSWKHTGVVEAFKAGVKPHDIMKQTGHRNRQSFEVYLKSLGLEENTNFMDLMPDLD